MPIPTLSPRMISEFHVRIVDSDIQNCESLSVLFRLEGFQTSFAISQDKALSSSSRLDVFVINLEMSDGSGLGLLKRVKAEVPGAPVFMLVKSPTIDAAVMAMKLGATDVFTQPVDTEHLLISVRDALRRDLHIGAMRDGRRSVEIRGFSALTPRERQVLQLLAEGRSNKSAGDLLEISSRTIEVHRAAIMKKLGAENAADLMRIVFTR